LRIDLSLVKYVRCERKGKVAEGEDTLGAVRSRERIYQLSDDAKNPRAPAPGGYISLVAHIWVGDDGKLIRGTIEDAHTGKRLAIDFSALSALLRESLEHAQMRTWNVQEVEEKIEEEQSGIAKEGPSDG
jgi:hypothetical protein